MSAQDTDSSDGVLTGRLQQRGKTKVCPICHGQYELAYPSRSEAPAGTVGRMQYDRGICSRACELAAENGGSLR